MNYKRVTALVNLGAIRNNALKIREKLGSDVRLMAVVKADGYGHGSIEVARALDDVADFYGVAIIEEALALRGAGVKKPMLILGYTSPEQFAEIIKNNISQTIFDFESAAALSAEAVRQNKTAKIHIAIDTGMSRIGFCDEAESVSEICRIAALPNVVTEGLFSHYACADRENTSSADGQRNRFKAFAKKLEEAGVSFAIKHLSNSAGIMEIDESFDMVRAGIAIYGLYPSEEVDKNRLMLEPAMQLKTRIIMLKTLKAGLGVSYGHTYITKRPTRVATLPVGYADGYPRALSSKGRVIVKGQFAPVIGRVCMDQMMIDVSDIPGVETGDEVILMGQSGDCVISAQEIGEKSESFNYEVVCGISKRVPREYI